MGPVAVIDIGSNSIKALVAERSPDGSVRQLFARTLDARISAGISHAAPRLSEDGMQRGIDAVRELLTSLKPFSPDAVTLVATSAVRDAANGTEFCARLLESSGHPVRVLGGDEEANLIGKGLTCDPDLSALQDFYVFDLGGGSLECLAFHQRHVQQAISLQLGCVRLTERFFADAGPAMPEATRDAIHAHVTAALTPARFRFSLAPGSAAVATGGTVTTARAIWAARAGVALEQTERWIPLPALRDLARELADLPLEQRKKIAGLPPARADVFPTALFTLVALADAGGFSGFQHSFYNLRFGIAAEMLAGG